MSKSNLSAMSALIGLAMMVSPAYANQMDGMQQEYYEVYHENGRVYVFGEPATYHAFIERGEPAFILTRVGAGPQKQTLVFGLSKEDTKKPVDDLQFVSFYYGKVEPAAEAFYGEVVKNGRFYVFDNWQDMNAFRSSGEAAYINTFVAKGPGNATLTLVSNKKNQEDQARLDSMLQRFKTQHGLSW